MPNICPDLDKAIGTLGQLTDPDIMKEMSGSGHPLPASRPPVSCFPLPAKEKRWALRGGPTFLALATLLKRRFLLSRRPPRAQPISRVRAELCRERNSLQISYLEECLRCRRG